MHRLRRRLDALVEYLVNVKQQYQGQEGFGLVGSVLENLMQRQPRARIRPRESTIRKGEGPG